MKSNIISMVKKGIGSFLLLMATLIINAQELSKDVFVVRPYEPTLSDAAKYKFMPSVNPIETTVPSFQYSITTRRLESAFEPDPIKAAKTVTTSLPKIYNSWLKLGLGNYSTPLVEFNISNLRSREYAIGAYMYHRSSHSGIRLGNEVKVHSGYVDNMVNIYGKRFFSGVTLAGGLNFEQHAFNYYGYNIETVRFQYEPDKDSSRQIVYKPGIDLEIKSGNADPSAFNFDMDASFNYFIDKQRNKEPELLLNTSFTKDISGFLGGLDMSLDYSDLTLNKDTAGITHSNTIFRFGPWISKANEDWQFKVGFEVAGDFADISNYYFYPKANLDIIIIKDVLIPFIGVSGSLKKNSYQNLFDENVFIKPGLTLKNTSSNFIAYGGLKGNISSVIRFRADASISVIKNEHFFVNDTITLPGKLKLHNQFTGEYDDINLITYHGQLVYKPGDLFEMMIDGKYFDYKIFEALKPWHKPDYQIELDAVYRYRQLDFGAGINIAGNRWVRAILADQTAASRKLKPVFDGNLNVNYHYSKLLTVFADFHNIAERSYMIWNQYPSQRFNFMVGFSYKL